MRRDQLTAPPSHQLPRRKSGAVAPPAPEPPAPESSSPSLKNAVETWLSDGLAQGFSPRTQGDREGHLRRFLWWLANLEALPNSTLSDVTPSRLRAFLAYCAAANPEGRFGSDTPPAKRAAKPATVHRYFRELRAFLNFCVAEGFLDATPLRNVKAPRLTSDQIVPFSEEQVRSLLAAVKSTRNSHRNAAILLLLLDTGLRVSELTSLRVGDASGETGELRVTGKGRKVRTVYLGQSARRALRVYLRKERGSDRPEEPLFVGDTGEAFTHWGVRIMIREAGVRAGIRDVRASPHTLRHTFAVTYLRNGGNLFELQRLMGHADLTVLRRYVLLAEGDLARAHRTSSPADRMGL